MNPKNLSILMITTLAILTSACSPQTSEMIPTQPETHTAGLSTLPVSSCDGDNGTAILNATLLVTIYYKLPDNPTGSAQAWIEGEGLATLVEADGELLLVTHDHWYDLAQADVVRMSNADGELLVELEGQKFNELVLFQDGGTTVLRAPVQLNPEMQALYASRGQSAGTRPLVALHQEQVVTVQPGQVVQVAHRCGANRDQVSVFNAVVEQVSGFKGLPAIGLKSLDGTVIQPGDSGGGIWLEGSLVGNMWTTNATRGPNLDAAGNGAQGAVEYLDTFTAAQLSVIPDGKSSADAALEQDY